MTRQIRRLPAALGLLLLPGCLSCLNPIPLPPCELKQTCEQIPSPCRARVYVVLINGADPFCCGNLSGVGEYLGGLGFVKIFYAQMYHDDCMMKELRVIHEDQPEARFAIVGFEHGSSNARKIATLASNEGLPVDLLVYLQPKGLSESSGVWQPNVRRQITIQAERSWSQDPALQEGEIVAVPSRSRYGVPTHSITLDLLATELTHLSMSIPFQRQEGEAFPSMLEDPAPTPRPIISRLTEKPDDWDFLKPVSRQRIRVENVPTMAEPPLPK